MGTGKKCNGRMLGFASALAASAAFIGTAQTVTTWTGTGDWNSAANWTEGVPAAGDEVVIAGNVVLTNATPPLASYTLNAGATHTFDGWDTKLNAATVTINGTMTHEQNSAATTNASGAWVPDARVWIDCSELVVAGDGAIDVSGKGYAGGVAVAGELGCGSGGGQCGGVNGNGGGAGHGGFGGRGGLVTSASLPVRGVGGDTYGAFDYPQDPGSGGGGGQATTGAGGNGGGVVFVEANTVAINGSIRADGTGGAINNAGGGSGGSVYIVCTTFGGFGTVSAIGGTGGRGNNSTGGSGGGGRIAVMYDPAAQANAAFPDVQFSAASGEIVKTGGFIGDIGTLYFPDSQLLERHPGPVTYNGQWMAPDAVLQLQNLVLDNAWLRFTTPGFTLNVAGDITLTGDNADLCRLEVLDGASIICDGDILVDQARIGLLNGGDGVGSLTCGGDMVLSAGNSTMASNSILTVYSGATNAAAPYYGALVDVAGLMQVGTGCRVCPWTNPDDGAGVFFKVGALDVAPDAGFDACGLGYPGGIGAEGQGPGKGRYNKNNMGGGGHGGAGGRATGEFGQPYGSASLPLTPGSGGGGDNNWAAQNNLGAFYPIGSGGGGVIRIEADRDVVLDGFLNADGMPWKGWNDGGGAGGSVFVLCRNFRGAGTVSAAGGESSNLGGGGGGGRIAIWQGVIQPQTDFDPDDAIELDVLSSFSGVITAVAGVATNAGTPAAEDGTIVFLQMPPKGTIMLLR